MLTVRHLSVGHGPIPALYRVSFSAEGGSITAVTGSSGTGKTTLADALGGFIPVREGRVIFDGADITHEIPNARLRRGISYVPASPRLFSELTVSENLNIAAAALATKTSRHQFDFVVSLFPEIRAWLGNPAEKLTSSQQRIVMIARGMMSAPRLLILDQPSSALSGEQTQRIYQAISQLNRLSGTAVLLFEPLSFQALKIADVVYCMDKGRITDGRIAVELLADQQVQAEFLHRARQCVPQEAAP
jgi:ABC-type branched-subunit amino acid transport system ATPase component